MVWQAYLTLVMGSPLAVSFLCSYFGYATMSKIIYRSETVLVTPLASAAILGYLGYYLAKKMARDAKPRPDGPCLDVIQSSIMVQVPLFFGVLSGIIGAGIDLSLLVKWAFWK